MATTDVTQESRIYHSLSRLNTAFAAIVGTATHCCRPDCSNQKQPNLFDSFTQELQADMNQEFLETLHQLELDDWSRNGKVREKREKHLKDPDDVFIHAEEGRKELAKQRKKH